MKEYFAILTSQSGQPVPMTNGEGIMEFFETQIEAESAAKDSHMGQFFGWEVFVCGLGVSDG